MKDLGISFKGGAARGLGSIGFIRLLQEEGIKPDIVAGSSSGGMVAAMYALGFSWEQMLESVRHFNMWRKFSLAQMLIGGSLVTADAFREEIAKLAGDVHIEQLPIKLVIFASDVKQQKRVALETGNLADAITASSAYPFLLPAVRIGHHKYIDGDLTSSYSANTVRSLGAKKVIGVSYNKDKVKVDFGRGLDKVVDICRYLGYQLEKEMDHLYPVDFEFKYSAWDVNYFDFNTLEKLVDRSYRHARHNRDKLLEVLG